MSFNPRGLASTIGRNTLFGFLTRIAQIGTRFVTVPIVIQHLGISGYGIWSIIMTTAAYMRFGSVGIKSAFQKYVAEATGDRDFVRANHLLSTGCAAMLGLSIVGLIPLAIYSTELARAAGVPPEFEVSASKALAVLAIIMVISNVGGVFEAILMGAHRIDLARNILTVFTICEAIAIVLVLRLGGGLFEMGCVMAGSEVGYVACCWFASDRIIPDIRVSWRCWSKKALPELVRFAGSYQLVNFAEIVYGAILPIAVLKSFGADASGVYALATRLVSSAMTLSDALLPPVLSGGALVYASKSIDGMRLLICKSYKVMLAISILPLGFICVFSEAIVTAWIGKVPQSLPGAMWLVALAGLVSGVSLLGVVLYRISGQAVLDNVRQGLRIATIFIISVRAEQLGFYGTLGGLALAEGVGLVFMAYVIARTFYPFTLSYLLPDTIKTLVTAAIVIGSAALAAKIIPVHLASARASSVLHLGIGMAACCAMIWPTIWLTGVITPVESKTLRNSLLTRHRAA